MFDAAKALKALLKAVKFPGVPAKKYGFNAMVMIEVEMLRSHDGRRGFVLQMQDLVDEVPLVVVIDQPDDSEDFPLSFKLLMGSLVPDHRPQGIGPACIGSMTNEIIHELKNVRLN